MSTSKNAAKSVKVSKVTKNARVEVDAPKGKKGKAAKTATVKLAPSTKISFLSPRPKGAGGPKTTLLNLVPRKGTITFAKLRDKAEAEELNLDRVPKLLMVMAKNGRIAIAA